METNTDEEVILNTQEETTDSQYVETDESSEDLEELKSRLAKAEELVNNYKIRAEKAEKRTEKTEVSKVAPKKQSDLSAIDIIAISKANIEAEDVEDVLDYAKFKGISLAEALKSPVVKATLTQKDELRKTAQATSTGTSRRGSASITDSQLMSNAEKGIMPESDEDFKRLAALRMKR